MLIDNFLKNKVIFITGATGTVGGSILRYIVENFYDDVKAIKVLSRDEYKLFKLVEEFKPLDRNGKIIPRLGDIRDREAITSYLSGVDVVIHSAALKRVEFGEFYPYEVVKTNIEGTKNIVDACIQNKVSRAVLISTDKAVEPTSIYGATKLCAERLFIAANVEERNNFKTLFSIVRFGNIVNSRGSIFEIIQDRKNKGEPIELTHPDMARYWITKEEASKFVVDIIGIMTGGEIFIPKMSYAKVIDIIKELYPSAEIVITSPRPGEKINESLISEYEKNIAFDSDNMFVIYPEIINSKKPYDTTFLRNMRKLSEVINLSFI
jgi:FlaA1/EpsC-like NDP-sugar epimerase